MQDEHFSCGYQSLDKLADVASGVTLGGIDSGANGIELPYLRVANVQDGHIVTDDVRTVRISLSAVDRFLLRRGDVVLTEGGDYDKLGRGAVWDGRIEPCLHQNHVFRVRCDQLKILPRYFALYIASPEGRSYFLRIAKRTTNLATISAAQLRSMPVPCPPLPEQRRVVETFEAVGFEELTLQREISKLRRIKQGLLGELFSSSSCRK